MMNKLLLVVDVQNDFINDNTKVTLQKIQELINANEYKNIVFTKFINNENGYWYKKLNYKGCLTEEGRNIPIDTSKYLVINKYGYSALNEELITYLNQNKIDAIFLCGFDTDACIYKTALDLFENGYNVYVLKDYCMSHKGLELHNVMIENLKRLIGKDKVV